LDEITPDFEASRAFAAASLIFFSIASTIEIGLSLL
jgi:hypothetical protein